MGLKSKYVIIKKGSFSLPFVFSELINHADVARALDTGGGVVGAGFCHIDKNGQYVCYGESISLRIKSGPGDAAILNEFLGVVTVDL